MEANRKDGFLPRRGRLGSGCYLMGWPTSFRQKNGVLVHLNVDDMDATLALIKANGGSIVREKTKIESEDRGYFAMFSDSEGNTLGLYSDK